MKGWVLAACLGAGLAMPARADHAAPSTRPVTPPEPDPVPAGESAPVELAAEGYKIKLTWFPAQPKPGDVVRFRAEVTGAAGAATGVVLKGGIRRTAPKPDEVLLPVTALVPDSSGPGGRFSFTQVFYVDGVYQFDFTVEDLVSAKQVKLGHALTIGSVQKSYVEYGIGIGAVALCALTLAIRRRKSGD